MNKLDKQYQKILQDILDFGTDKSDRTGTGTRSLFGHMIYHNMSEGFPLLTTKKMPFKTIAVELMWFLMGDTNIKYLVENGCHIWNGDAMKNYEKQNGEIDWGPFITKEEAFVDSILDANRFAEKWGELGPIYGSQWRKWGSFEIVSGEVISGYNQGIDQIKNLIEELKTNPDSRRLMVNAWNVGELNKMVLPPCHYGFQVYSRELSEAERFHWYGKKIGSHMHHDHIVDEMNQANVPTRGLSLMWNQRSVDTFLGLPFNIASYGLLLTMLAKEVNMIPDKLIGSLGDTHLYLNHIDQAKELISREPKRLPELGLSSNHNFRAALKNKPEEIEYSDFILVGYDPHPTIKAPLSN